MNMLDNIPETGKNEALGIVAISMGLQGARMAYDHIQRVIDKDTTSTYNDLVNICGVSLNEGQLARLTATPAWNNIRPLPVDTFQKLQNLARVGLEALAIPFKLPNRVSRFCTVTITDSPATPRPRMTARISCAESASAPNFCSRSRGLSEIGRS